METNHPIVVVLARNLLLSVLLVLSSSSSLLGGSTSEAFAINGLHVGRLSLMKIRTPFVQSCKRRTVFFSSPQDDDEDDDGWGSPAVVDEKSNFDRDRKVDELRFLREEASNKVASSSSSQPTNASEPPERDMFIPIMAIVSLLGLFGAYGYETLRLASRGELYLPF